MQISGWLQCWWWWCVRLLDWLEPVIPPHQLCVCCAVVYRPGATTGYDIVAAQPSAQRQAANRASYTPYSPTATLSSSHYYYHILTLRNCSVCTVEYQGASDVIELIGTLSRPSYLTRYLVPSGIIEYLTLDHDSKLVLCTSVIFYSALSHSNFGLSSACCD